MMAEIQGLSTGAGGGLAGGAFGLAGLGDDPNSGPSPLFPGAGRGAGYLGPGLQAGGAAEKAAEGTGSGGGGGGSAAGQNQNGGGTEEKKRGGAAFDEADLGDPLSPRNREYRRKMIEMHAQHKVRLLGRMCPQTNRCCVLSKCSSRCRASA